MLSKKSKKTNDITFFNNKYQNVIDNWELNENNLFDIDESLSYNEDNLVHKDTVNYQWVYDLRLNDYANEKFSKKVHVIVRGNWKLLMNISLAQLQQMTKHQFQEAITSILVIQRPDTTQLYIVNGLQKSLHFSLGSQSVKHNCVKNTMFQCLSITIKTQLKIVSIFI